MDRDRLISEILTRGVEHDGLSLDVETELGRGGNGVALLCRDVGGREIVVKVYIPPDKRDLDEQSLARFYNEIKLAERLQHPNVIAALGSGSIRVGAYQLPYYSMPAASSTLRNEVGTTYDGPALTRIARIFIQTCLGVSCLHSHGVVHRDLKPENVLLSRQDIPWVADLGIAHIEPEFVSISLKTVAAEKLLNRDYYAPEQRFKSHSEVDRRADIYALGCILYELLVGHPPVRRDSPPVVSANEAFAGFDDVINRMTAYDAAARYQYVEEAISDVALAFGWAVATIVGARSPSPTDLAAMEKSLRSVNDVNRAKGVAVAVKLGKPALPTLHDLMGHGRRDVRNSTARALGEIGDPSSVPYLVAGLYSGSNKPTTFRPYVDTALEALLRFPVERRIEALRAVDSHLRPQQVAALLRDAPPDTGFDLAKQLHDEGRLLLDWGESEHELLAFFDEERAWSGIYEAASGMYGYALARLLKSLPVERQVALAKQWMTTRPADAWHWESMVPAIVQIEVEPNARLELLQELDVMLDEFPGVERKRDSLRWNVRNAREETPSDASPGTTPGDEAS